MQITKGSLTIVGANTQQMKVFWNGVEIKNIISLGTEFEAKHDKDPDGDNRVKIRVSDMDDVLFKELTAAGIIIKRGRTK